MPIQIILVSEEEANEEQRVRVCKKCTCLEDSVYHMHLCPRVGAEKPNPILGKELTTIEEVRFWLSHPSNQKEASIFIVHWDGVVPYIHKREVERLWEGDGLAEVILIEHIRRKRGGKIVEFNIPESDG